ncbi:MAG: DUF3696 domain-containing protein [Pseudomonadota bacterium]
MEPESVGYVGENTVAAILAARNRKISLGYKRPAKPFEEIIALKLKEMGLIEEFKVNPISEQRQEYEVKVRTKGSRDWVDLPDVGFGISQVLPVLVQCFYAPAGSIILMEQPEIHLHPNAQSALADVMIDVINSRENGSDRDIQLVIETHSEHFLRRLQRRIAEDAVPQEKVSAYFANIAKTPATLEQLQIDIFGNIQNWPENFFGDEMGDITDALFDHLSDRYILFGEWCYAQHSIFHDRLPDWFLSFDIYDREARRFLASVRRDRLLDEMHISKVPDIARGRFSYPEIQQLLLQSKLTDQQAEGIYLRISHGDWLKQRAKLVRPAFIQAVEQHWSRSAIRPNRLNTGIEDDGR